MVERILGKAEVGSSILPGGTTFEPRHSPERTAPGAVAFQGPPAAGDLGQPSNRTLESGMTRLRKRGGAPPADMPDRTLHSGWMDLHLVGLTGPDGETCER